MKNNRSWIGFSALFVLLFTLISISSGNVLGQTICSLETEQAYSHRDTNSVWYLSEDCTKRPILNPAVYFSHFSSWNDVHVVERSVIENIPNSRLGFLPWGPFRKLHNGELIKITDDPRVYVLLNGAIFPIPTEQAFRKLGYEFEDILDVMPSVLRTFAIGKEVDPDDEISPSNVIDEVEEGDDQEVTTEYICGNGIKEVGEFCDDGDINGRAGECNLQCSAYLPLKTDLEVPAGHEMNEDEMEEIEDMQDNNDMPSNNGSDSTNHNATTLSIGTNGIDYGTNRMGGGGNRVKSPLPVAGFTSALTDAERSTFRQTLPASEFGVPFFGGPVRFYSECGISHVGNDDPIVFYGQPGVSHLHVFIGNQDTDAYSTTESLMASTKHSTCRGGLLNRTAYWFPALINGSGQPIIPDADEFQFISYGTSVPGSSVVAPPTGLRMIAGNAAATNANPQGVDRLIAYWECGSDYRTRTDHIPTCKPGDELKMSVTFPQCWDGVNLDSDNQKDHMAYPFFRLDLYDANGTHQFDCPSSHPIAIPEVTLNVNYRVSNQNLSGDADTSHWSIASDMYDLSQARGGYSLHADWFNGWDEQTMQDLVELCLHQSANCNNGGFPDYTQMVQRARGTLRLLP